MQKQGPSQTDVDTIQNTASTSQPSNKKNHSLWKMDLHALGVSHKIKRLKQQLVLVERVTGKQANDGDAEISDDSQGGIKAYHSIASLLNKQVGRYQSLQEKTDDLRKRLEMEKSAGIDMKPFADSIRTLFLEVQRGLEVKTARIIGDLEGTLASEGMIQLRR